MRYSSKPVGWRNESHRHYLAAKGISTKRYRAIKPKYGKGIWGFEDTDTKEFFYDAESAEKEKRIREERTEDQRIASLSPEEYAAEFEEDEDYDEDYEQAEAENEYKMQMYEEQKNLEKYGVNSMAYEDFGSVELEKEQDGMALIKYYDNYSPASEHPVTYEIRDESGNVLWKSGITYMAEYVFEGVGRSEVTGDIKAEAEEAFNNLLTLDTSKR